MPRHWSARVLHALVATWFVLSVGEPSVAHFCPTHGGTLAELAHAAPAMDMDAGHSSMHHASHTDHGRNHGTHHCSCISSCVGAGAAALRPDDVALGAPSFEDVSTTPIVGDVLPRSAPRHAQPLATGPPGV